jgi:NADPH2:quinone reductase
MKAIRVHRHGGPESLSLDELAVPDVAAGQVLVRVLAAGVNFLDVYHRTGLYPVQLPLILGQEGAGTVEAVGTGVHEFTPGDRVAWAAGPGSYATFVAVPAANVVAIPDAVSTGMAAAVMIQGMTAHYLAFSAFPLEPAHTCLVYAAAGGVGQLLVQIAKLRGAAVIGTVSSAAKADFAREAGADHVIRYDQDDVASEVRRITAGRGVDVAYDSVGKASWEWSLNSLRPRGMLVSFGNSSGPVGNIDPLVLSRRGSLFLTRPTLAHYTATRAELEWRAHDLFTWIAAQQLRVRIDRELPLEAANEGQRALEARETAGKVLLIP